MALSKISSISTFNYRFRGQNHSTRIYCIDKYQRPTEAQWPKVDGGLLFVEAAEAFSSTPT